MKIAVPVTNDNQLDEHFGHCDFLKIYETENNKVLSSKKISSGNGCGCKSGIASTLAAGGVTVMLAGGIGNGAINTLQANGIKVIRGCQGNPDELIVQYLDGKLSDSGESCQHHEHHHRHEQHSF